ncbi:MAG TPA: GNAT family N-acetyltransferase [Pseudonocardia sp.]|nr:GNAT family N-acetyltransferase [Pseudonocardia sp.]
MTATPVRAVARPATAADRAELTRVLAAAFADDPVFAWLVPDRAARLPRLEPVFDAFADAFARHDETHLADDGAVHGAAVWAPPGVEPVHPDDEPAFDARIGAVLGEHAARVEICMARFAAIHPHEPAWYLQFLGVDPAEQGRGLGSLLLRDVLARADAADQPAYLEATSPRNRALYERHGFTCIADIPLPDGPTGYAMWRPTRSGR